MKTVSAAAVDSSRNWLSFSLAPLDFTVGTGCHINSIYSVSECSLCLQSFCPSSFSSIILSSLFFSAFFLLSVHSSSICPHISSVHSLIPHTACELMHTVSYNAAHDQPSRCLPPYFDASMPLCLPLGTYTCPRRIMSNW